MKQVEAITLKPGDIVLGAENNPSISGTVKAVRMYPADSARTEETGEHHEPANWAGAEIRQRNGIGHKAQTSTTPPDGKTAAIITEAQADTYSSEKIGSVSIQIGNRSFSVTPGTKLQKVG